MDYEKITDKLIQRVISEFNLEKVYQEFLDSLVELNDFNKLDNKKFQEYLDKNEL